MKPMYYVSLHGADENSPWMRESSKSALDYAKGLTAMDGKARAVVMVQYIVKRECPVVVVTARD